MTARGEKLPPGPEWEQEKVPQYRQSAKFVRRTPHTKARAWARLVPKVDGMVLDIINNFVDYELDRPLELPEKDPQNGMCAREHKEQLSAMLMKDLKSGTYEVCTRKDLDVVLPFNLAPKSDGVPFLWRVCPRAITVNEALDDVKSRFEGVRTMYRQKERSCTSGPRSSRSGRRSQFQSSH